MSDLLISDNIKINILWEGTLDKNVFLLYVCQNNKINSLDDKNAVCGPDPMLPLYLPTCKNFFMLEQVFYLFVSTGSSTGA